jgi:hypothetical protein
MGGKGSGRPRMSCKQTLVEILRLTDEIQGQLEANYNTMNVLMQRLLYYTKTVNKRWLAHSR